MTFYLWRGTKFPVSCINWVDCFGNWPFDVEAYAYGYTRLIYISLLGSESVAVIATIFFYKTVWLRY